jgi:anaerobic selenocysteine-containing dehydrogenase
MSATNDENTNLQDRMLGSVPGVPAVGRGPATDGAYSRHEYHHPAAGWGAARSVGHVLESRGTPAEGVRALFVMNQENGGFDDRIRDTMAQVLDGFEDFNERVRRPHGFRLSQPARERGFLTPSGRAEFGLAPLAAGTDPGPGRLLLATVRSHDQFNTTIYSNDDRYRGLKGLRTVVFMNEADMRDRGLGEFDLIDITSTSSDGSTRSVYGYRAVRYEIPPGCAAGYMPELNVLCGIADYSSQSGQPVTKHLTVEITPSPSREKG